MNHNQRIVMNNTATHCIAATNSAAPNHTTSIAWLGLDAHSKNCVLAQLDDQGRELHWWQFPTRPEQLIAHIQAVPAADKRLMLEESNLARWLGQLLKPHVHQLVVCDARRNRLISHDPHKHDRRDAFALARLLRLNEFKPVWQPTEPERVLFKRIAQSYENAVQRQTRLKLQLKALFQHWGLFPAGSTVFSKTGRNDWLKQLPYDALRSQTLLLYELLDQSLASQSQFRRLMCQTGREFPEVKRLRTVPGVGLVGAHLFVAYVQDPKRFTKFSQLTRYCRLGIRDRSSDDKPLGFQQLDHQGVGTLKAISYRAYLQAAKRRTGPVWDFYQFSLRQTGSTTHARLNTQRKLLLTLWNLWLTGGEFEPETFSRSQLHDV
jgi:transposase